jgi:ubiquinone/menaquinone biosynthesis C-methylase UbiE
MALERVLEPEVMDTYEEADDYDSMDHSEVNRAFVTDFLAAGDVTGLFLDLGTGTALIPIELCERHEDCYVMAADASVHMLEMARYNIEIAGQIERIQLDHSDAKDLPYKDGYFAAVISNSIVHHVPDPTVVLKEAIRVVELGGLLFFRDLMRPGSDEEVRQFVETYAGQENEHQQQMFENSLRAALNLEEMRQLVADLGFDPETVQATSDRHWTWNARKPS